MAFTAKILLLGSGELGREFVISAKRLGAQVIACDAYAGAPAMQLADGFEIFSMLDGDYRLAGIRSKPLQHIHTSSVPPSVSIRHNNLRSIRSLSAAWKALYQVQLA